MSTAEQYQYDVFLDENGLLINTRDWNASMALEIANGLGIDNLDAEHWQVIHALRKHYEKFGAAPCMHNICRAHGQHKNWVHNLFKTCLNAWRIAGLPDPGEEAREYLNDM